MKIFKLIFLSLVIVELLFSYTPAFAQTTNNQLPVYNPGVDQQVKYYLCTDQVSLFDCINKLYKFAIVLASVVAVFFIVIAGYLYIGAGGNNEQITSAKNILQSSIASIIILLVGYVLLKAINPDLIVMHSITPQTVTLPSGQTVVTGGPITGPVGGGCTNCVNLSSVGVPTRGNAVIYSDPTLAAKLQSLKSQPGLASIHWYVTASYDPAGGHLSTCHQNGSCADISTDQKNDISWNALCSAIKAIGFSSVLNEASPTASQCNPYQTYSSTTGANLHVVE